MRPRALLALVALVALLAPMALAPTAARADRERVLGDLDAVRDACRFAEARPAREVLVAELDPGWRFGTLTEDGFLAIEARRNFRALRGRAELFTAGLEPIGFVATPERADELEAARARGARLRVGFFLGFDQPDRTACVVRSRFGVSTIRMDVAFVELLAPDGTLIAREDTDRYRAWHDDAERNEVPGTGPRAAIDAPSTPSGAVPDAWRDGLTRATAGDVGRALSVCHRDGIARGAETTGRVVVRLRVDGRTGRVVESELALSDLGDTEEAECVAGALRGVALPPGPGEWATRTVELTVPVRLVAE